MPQRPKGWLLRLLHFQTKIMLRAEGPVGFPSNVRYADGFGSGRLPKQCAVCRQIFCMPCLAVLCKEKDENPSTIMKNV